MTDRYAARAAKTRLAAALRANEHVNGLGLANRKGDWVVKVNLTTDDRGSRSRIPAEVDGVSVVVEVVGDVQRARASRA